MTGWVIPAPIKPIGPSELREKRAWLGMSQAKLADALGVPVNTLARWERGDLPIRHPKMLGLALYALIPELE